MGKASMTACVEDTPCRRRRWTKQEKRRIVEETLAPGASVARVARAHEVNANQVHAWRRLHERGMLSGDVEPTTLLPVRVVRGEASLSMERISGTPAAPWSTRRPRRARAAGVIQIEVERGRLQVEGSADPTALRVVLECLLG